MNIELILAIVVGVMVILFIGYRYMNNKTKEIKDTQEDETNTSQTTKKVLKYFGGDYCPFSNSNSNAYKVVKDFESEYSDKVDVEYYWVGLDDEIMKELNVEYVPYLLNDDNKQIEIALPEGIDASNMEESELKELLLRTIYEKL
jgi:hypothetical protein